MARGDQLIRQWKLLHVLAVRGGRPVPELMREAKCSRRTVWRDLAVLQQAGFPLTNEQDGRESRYRLIEGPRGIPPVPFTLTELMSLRLARHLLVPLRGTPVGEAIHTALEKVSATLGPAAKNFLASLDQSMSARAVQAKDYSHALETRARFSRPFTNAVPWKRSITPSAGTPSVAAGLTRSTSGTSRAASMSPPTATPGGRCSPLPSNDFGGSA